MAGSELQVLEPAIAPEVYFDEITDIQVSNGVFRCTLVSNQMIYPMKESVQVAVMRAVIPACSVPAAARAALAAVSGAVVLSLIGKR